MGDCCNEMRLMRKQMTHGVIRVMKRNITWLFIKKRMNTVDSRRL